MQALWLEDRQLSMREVDVPQTDGEALIRVTLSGVCGTDIELARGYYPFTGVIGHEFVGEVVESPDPAWVGRRVVGEINAVCGACEACRNGRPTHCESRTVLGIAQRNGAHAEYVTLPVANLHAVPDSVSDEAAVFTEPLAAAIEILQQVHVRPDDRVLLVGAGRLGQLVAQVLALTGARLHVVARHERQRDLLHARGIETHRRGTSSRDATTWWSKRPGRRPGSIWRAPRSGREGRWCSSRPTGARSASIWRRSSSTRSRSSAPAAARSRPRSGCSSAAKWIPRHSSARRTRWPRRSMRLRRLSSPAR